MKLVSLALFPLSSEPLQSRIPAPRRAIALGHDSTKPDNDANPSIVMSVGPVSSE
jgi:hypothetical protein